MRRIFTTALSLLALEGATRAADLPPAPQLPPLEAQPTWTGFYAGLNVGGAFGSSRNAFTIAGFGLPSFNTSLDGVVGGAEAVAAAPSAESTRTRLRRSVHSSPPTIAARRETAGRWAAASKSNSQAAGARKSNIFISIWVAGRRPIS